MCGLTLSCWMITSLADATGHFAFMVGMSCVSSISLYTIFVTERIDFVYIVPLGLFLLFLDASIRSTNGHIPIFPFHTTSPSLPKIGLPTAHRNITLVINLLDL
ncbi:unnamed protein product [Cuscuta europaea]|uniref:Uncharacterized protein n=1 Tax=Cuscuta europaea TaxID=41803 RepID=A0A9P1E0V1_CUSEU|nr:unnamed protein product [Cuscuta europaea]